MAGRIHLFVLVLAVVLLAGCSGDTVKDKGYGPRQASATPEGSERDLRMARTGLDREQADEQLAAKQEAPRARKPEEAEPAKRKIIYNANLQLVVKDLDEAEKGLRALIGKHKALIANSALTGSAGTPRSGHWKIRVPADAMDDFIQQVLVLGIPEKNTTDSDDVTERYDDLEASIKNYKSEEEALRKLVEKAVKMEDVIAFRRELNQLREKIAHLEGQFRRLSTLTALATVDVTLREEKDYQPPAAPGFGNTVSKVFTGSINALVGLGKGVVVAAVAVAPWLPLCLLVVVPVWMVVRRSRRQVA
jgi:hypothetical protein